MRGTPSCSNRAPSTTNGRDRRQRQRRGSAALRTALRADHQARPGADLRADPRGRAGVPTTGLLTATQYLKDNRLLPRGFDKATAARGDCVSTARPPSDADLPERRRSRALRGRGVRRQGPTGSKSSCGTSRSATGGRTTSMATTLRSRSGSLPITGRCPLVLGRRSQAHQHGDLASNADAGSGARHALTRSTISARSPSSVRQPGAEAEGARVRC